MKGYSQRFCESLRRAGRDGISRASGAMGPPGFKGHKVMLPSHKTPACTRVSERVSSAHRGCI